MFERNAGDSTLRDDALRLLARREHSRVELARRLAAKGHAQARIDECIDELAAQGLQSDARFAESFLRSRLFRGQGPVKIRLEMERRGLDPEEVRDAFAAGEVDWQTLACETLSRRFSGPGGSPRERARRERFLAGRGFDFDQVRHALAHAWSPDPDDA